MQKTAIVEIERMAAHPLYKKRVRRKNRLKVHDELGVKVGDTVRIASSRPFSKEKHFEIKEVVKK